MSQDKEGYFAENTNPGLSMIASNKSKEKDLLVDKSSIQL